MKICIVDYGMGNLGSVQNMLKKLGVTAQVTARAEDLMMADRMILPGVGHFNRAMQNLRERNLIPILQTSVLERKIPTLGICLGMQLLTQRSEEGFAEGLGWIQGEVKKFAFPNEPKRNIPHMGWNQLREERSDPLLAGLTEEDSRFYFVHSYYVTLKNRAEILAETDYGLPFVSVLRQGHVLGAQFHPEKSHRYGMRLFQNFIEGSWK